MPALGVSAQWIAAAIAGALCLYMLVRVVFGRHEADYVAEVRRLARLGEYEKAGLLQYRHGHVEEALNLFVRGSRWKLAATASARLGNNHDAAEYAKQAGEWERAAKLYTIADEPELAAECYREVGMLVDAAEALEGKGRPREVANAWEAAFNQRCAEIGPTGDESALPELASLAKHVTKAMTAVGDVVRARDFEELTRVDVLRHRLGFADLDIDAGTVIDAPEGGHDAPGLEDRMTR